MFPLDKRQAKPLTAKTLPAEVTRAGNRVFRITLREGRNRQIRRMCEALGYEVVTLHRERFLGIGLDGLEPGEWCVVLLCVCSFVGCCLMILRLARGFCSPYGAAADGVWIRTYIKGWWVRPSVRPLCRPDPPTGGQRNLRSIDWLRSRPRASYAGASWTTVRWARSGRRWQRRRGTAPARGRAGRRRGRTVTNSKRKKEELLGRLLLRFAVLPFLSARRL